MSGKKMQNEVGMTDTVQRDPGQAFSKIDDEVVMLSLEKGEYYALNPVAARIWEMLEQPVTVKNIVDQLLQEFDVKDEQCTTETLFHLNELAKKSLLIIEK